MNPIRVVFKAVIYHILDPILSELLLLLWCKRCGICIAFCPPGVYGRDEKDYPVVEDITRCTACGLCAAICPDFAILTEKETVKRMGER